ncbi:hypothetical protein [uncultured Clostridium sp.]|uniref:hypothetical protein n=1 Tax=uncultured Clostridium sp. TaxID=59620 RepID=UPI0026311A04|nr:hypothetical protein [uncultured Clostridium sp.]
MKKKVLATLLVTAGIMNTTGVAFASELPNSSKGMNLKVEAEVEKDLEDDEMGVVSDVAIEQLDYAIEDMRIAVETLENEGMTVENIDYIVRFGTQSIERVRPFFEELEGSKEMKAHLEWINQSWTRISEAVEIYHTAGDGSAEDNMGVTPEVEGPVLDGTEEDNMGVVSDVAIEQLDYAIEEMRIAINTLEKDGMTVENIDYIVRFGSTSIERVRPFFEELEGSKEMKAHLEWINQSWIRISEAVEIYHTAGDGSAEDNMGVTPEVEGPVLDGTDEDNMEVMPDEELEIDPGFEVNPELETAPEIEEEVEGPVLDGTDEDNMEVTPEVEGPVLDGTDEDNIEVTPEVETSEVNTNNKDVVSDKTETQKPVEEVKNNIEEVSVQTNLPKTGASKTVGILATVLGLLGIAKFAIKK